MIFHESSKLEKLKDQDKAKFEKFLQFCRDGVNVDQNGDGNLGQTNLDFDIIGDASVSDKGPNPLPIVENEQSIVEQPKNVDDREVGTANKDENQVPMISLRRLRSSDPP